MLFQVSLYDWVGISNNGAQLKGRIQAAHLSLAKHTLLKQGIIIQDIHLAYIATLRRQYHHSKRITNEHVTSFTRQLSTLVKTGIPLLQSIDMISTHQHHLSLIAVLKQIQHDLAKGTTLTESLKPYPQVFDNLYCHLIEVGEQSGKLCTVLSTLVHFREKSEQLMRNVKKALFYPALVMGTSLLISSLLLLFVIPQFQEVFQGLGATLPAFTLFVIALSMQLQHHWLILIGLMLGSFSLIHYSFHRIASCKQLIDKYLLACPIIGPIIKNAILARMTRSLAITFSAGLPLFDALKLAAHTAGNHIYENTLLDARNSVAAGERLHLAFAQTQRFPDLMIQLIAIGEESGCLEEMLLKIVDHYDQEVETAIEHLTTFIEPVMICLLGLFVGGLVLAMYLPIFQIGSMI